MEIDEECWSYEDEIKLLDLMTECGPDNWEGISKRFDNRRPDECEKYYLNNFILNPKYSELIAIINDSKFRKQNSVKSCRLLESNVLSPACDYTANGILTFKNDETDDNIIGLNQKTCDESVEYVSFDGNDFQQDLYCDSLNIKQEIINETYTKFSNETVNFSDDIFLGKLNSKLDSNITSRPTPVSSSDLFNIGTDYLDNSIFGKDEVIIEACMQSKSCDSFKCNVYCDYNNSKSANLPSTIAQNYSFQQNTFESTCSTKQCCNDFKCTNYCNVINMKSESTFPAIKKEISCDIFDFNSETVPNVNSLLDNGECDVSSINCNFIHAMDAENVENEIEKLLNDVENISSQNSVHQKVHEILNNQEFNVSDIQNECNNENDRFLNILKVNCEKGLKTLDTNNCLSDSNNFCNNVSNSNNYDSYSRDYDIENLSPKNTSETLTLITGYNPARNEFEVEYDNNAENILTCLCNNDGDNHLLKSDNLITELSFALIKIYNFRLSERIRRKHIVRRYNLINPLKTYSWYSKYKNILGERSMKKFIRFVQVIDAHEFDGLLKEFKKMNELKSRLDKLIEYRLQGLTKLGTVELYELSRKQRDESLRILRCSVTPVIFMNTGLPIITSSSRRPAPPISVTNMPGYSDLDENESEFCSINRILPNSYLQFKDILANECSKKNGIKLAQARALIKIDVNKTRKLFDFLIGKKIIWLPNNN